MIAPLKNYTGKSVVLTLRPEHIRVQTNPARTVAANLVEAAVERSEALGAETILYLASNGREFVARGPAGRSVSRGEILSLVFDLRHAHFFDPMTQRRIG